jgi:hypothetical protein
MDLKTFELNGKYYLFDSVSNKFWQLIFNSESMHGILIIDSALITKLNEEVEGPANPIMPGESGNE